MSDGEAFSLIRKFRELWHLVQRLPLDEREAAERTIRDEVNGVPARRRTIYTPGGRDE